MLDRPQEYQKMAAVERELWWYQTLHKLVLREIQRKFGDRKDIQILDAGCGTGGLMSYLRDQDYTQLSGFDLSEHAVRFSKDRGLDVKCLNIKDIAQGYAGHSFDVIISNDVLYFLNESERSELFPDIKRLLKKDRIFISNVPALDAFRGMHDLSVGIQKRFTKSSFLKAVNRSDFTVVNAYFWPFFLSPMIYLARLAQRISMSKDENKAIESDVELPSAFVNRTLHAIASFENAILPWKPFGSSLLVTLKRL